MKNRGFSLRLEKGFTLLELILVIAIIAILAAATVPLMGNFNQRTQVDAVARQMVSALRFAQQKSVATESDSQFGVYFDDGNNRFIVFRGATYGSFPAEDRIYTYTDAITVTQSFPSNEVTFEKGTGNTVDIGSISIANDVGGLFTVTVSGQGKIEL